MSDVLNFVAISDAIAPFTAIAIVSPGLEPCGAIALLRYLADALLMPGAPLLPIEVGFDGSWETAFRSTCRAVANSLAALATEPTVVDRVAESIVDALAPAVEDYETAKRAARSAIQAFVDGGLR